MTTVIRYRSNVDSMTSAASAVTPIRDTQRTRTTSVQPARINAIRMTFPIVPRMLNSHHSFLFPLSSFERSCPGKREGKKMTVTRGREKRDASASRRACACVPLRILFPEVTHFKGHPDRPRPRTRKGGRSDPCTVFRCPSVPPSRSIC